MLAKDHNNFKTTDSLSLLGLAVSCKLITVEQEQEIFPHFLDLPKKNLNFSVASFLLEKKILSQEDLNYLDAIQTHLNILMSDKQFGKLGISNQFVAPEKVKRALDMQIQIFKKKKKSVKIGDILVLNKDITEADKTALLLTQDRIKDELLAEAMNTIAKSEMEKIEIHKRFGAIAVKKKLIDIDQLNEALKAQKKEVKEGKEKRYIGDLLKEMFNISDTDIIAILKAQKKLECKRLNLENNLIRYNAEKESNELLDEYYEYYVTDDKLKAFVRRKKQTAQTIPLTDFLNWFLLSGIKYGICESEKINSFLTQNKISEHLEIARGHATKPAGHQEVEYYFDTQFLNKNDNLKQMPCVKKGDILATITSPNEERPGKDVFGRQIKIYEEPVVILKTGQGVLKRKNKFIAKMTGHPKLLENQTLSVTPIMESVSTKVIEGDMTVNVEDEYLEYNLEIKGNINPGIHVACHHLIVEGSIMGSAATSGNIDIKGGIGVGITEGDKPIDPAKVEAKGRIRVGQAIENSIIVARKGLMAPGCDLVSSRVLAYREIVVNNIISTRKAPSILRITRDNILEIEKNEKAICALKKGYDKLLHKPELDQLSNELMEQIQVQNGYLEKQNVMIYLNRIITDARFKEIKNIDQKIKAFEQGTKPDDSQISIPVNTKAHRFMKLILEKAGNLNENDQVRYIQEFHDNISALYKTAVRSTEKYDKKFDARSKTIEIIVEQSRQKIDKIKAKIDEFMSQKDLLLPEQQKFRNKTIPVIKVKYQVDSHTIILGEKAKMVVHDTIYGVSLREDTNSETHHAKIQIDGYYE